MINYNKVWGDLKQELKEYIIKLGSDYPDYKDYIQDLGYSICASPLKLAKILVLGANWGGTEKNNPGEEREMPWANELLSDWIFAKNFQRFLSKILGSDEKAIYLIWKHTVYTNVCLLRTRNTKNEIHCKKYKVTNRDVYHKGLEISKPILMKIIQVVRPEIIICAGNGKNNKVKTATAIVSEITGGNKINWWEDEDIVGYKVSGKNFYVFKRNLNGSEKVTVLSFPHFSRATKLTEEVMKICQNTLKTKN